MRALALASLLALSACGSKEKAEEPVAATPSPTGPHLGDVSLDQPLRATDNALTWSLEVAPGSIMMTRFAGHGSQGSVSQFYPVAPQLSDDKAVWTTKDTAGAPVTITFTNTHCTEGGDPAIDRPLTAEVKIGETMLHGCAGARPADGLNSQPLAEPGNVALANDSAADEVVGNGH
ncbi:hypothetical protein P6144_09230 [Sphingomonas sp. HITSZ_GF]|uniref:hypothetical protein n=1 Tax=Sphingomonas sp. HITSZ_GF TaxID=3037247 RepID=UPI00240DC1C6|nr:hypothetical protein [Sphingomonas sp. HITSZ_GF]MDG2533827.1 hypothetical protein [Sphingomonas sp. HITSZ_GF]